MEEVYITIISSCTKNLRRILSRTRILIDSGRPIAKDIGGRAHLWSCGLIHGGAEWMVCVVVCMVCTRTVCAGKGCHCAVHLLDL